MTREEAIEVLKYQSENDVFVGTEWRRTIHDALGMAIRSLEAWDEVIKHLETTIREIQSTEMDQDCTMFCQGLTFAVAMIKNHLKEVDNG